MLDAFAAKNAERDMVETLSPPSSPLLLRIVPFAAAVAGRGGGGRERVAEGVAAARWWL